MITNPQEFISFSNSAIIKTDTINDWRKHINGITNVINELESNSATNDLSFDTLSFDLNSDSINTTKLKNNAITSNTVANEAVTTEKLGNTNIAGVNVITSSKLADTIVTSLSNILDNDSIITEKIKDNAIVTSHIDIGAVTTNKIENLNVYAQHFNDNTINVDHLSTSDPLVGSDFANDEILSNNISNETITSNAIADLGITVRNPIIATNAITTSALVDNFFGTGVNQKKFYDGFGTNIVTMIESRHIEDASISMRHIRGAETVPFYCIRAHAYTNAFDFFSGSLSLSIFNGLVSSPTNNITYIVNETNLICTFPSKYNFIGFAQIGNRVRIATDADGINGWWVTVTGRTATTFTALRPVGHSVNLIPAQARFTYKRLNYHINNTTGNIDSIQTDGPLSPPVVSPRDRSTQRLVINFRITMINTDYSVFLTEHPSEVGNADYNFTNITSVNKTVNSFEVQVARPSIHAGCSIVVIA